MKRPLNEYEHFKFAVSVCKNACKLLTKHRNTPLAKRKDEGRLNPFLWQTRKFSQQFMMGDYARLATP